MQRSLALFLVLSLIVVGAATLVLDAQEGTEPLSSADPSVRATVVAALDDLVAALVAERPANAAAYTEHVRPTWRPIRRFSAVLSCSWTAPAR